MFGWLAKKGEDARVAMCVKELKWDLETAQPLRRAKILALAQLLRSELLSASGLPTGLIDQPFNYDRATVVQLYTTLETIRNSSALELEQSKKVSARIGMPFPALVEQQSKDTRRAIEVWMISVGVGVLPSARDDARAIWALLWGEQAFLPAAMRSLRDMESELAATFGTEPTGMFSSVPDGEWLALCQYRPTMVTGSV